MQAVTTIGLDIAKSVFQVHGVDAEGKVVIAVFFGSFAEQIILSLRRQSNPLEQVTSVLRRRSRQEPWQRRQSAASRSFHRESVQRGRCQVEVRGC